MKRNVLFTLFLLLDICASPQDKDIQGKVTVLEELPVVGAEIIVKSSGLSYFTDTLGLFYVKCRPKDKLIFQAKGFHKREVRIAENSKYVIVDLKLKPGEKNLEIAVGYGYVKDKNRLYAISSASENEINYSMYSNILDALTGNFPGLQVQNGEIVIRNSPSFTGNGSALLILDGREVSLNSLTNISTHDIARISVLKDASSAVYGSRGGNGVVIVETKRGKEKSDSNKQ